MNFMEMEWVKLLTYMVAGIILRMGWDWLVDGSTLMLAWDGFRKALKDWRTFAMGLGAWLFVNSAAAGFEGTMSADAVTAFMPYAAGAIAAAGLVLFLGIMKSIWAGKANMKTVSDWLANPLKRAPELLATAAGSGAVLWVWGKIMPSIPFAMPEMRWTQGLGMFTMPNVGGMVSGSAADWLFGSISLLLIGIPAVMMIIHADGEDEGFVNSFTTSIKRYPGLVTKWKANLSWALGVSLVAWAAGAMSAAFMAVGGGSFVGDVMQLFANAVQIATMIGVTASLYGLKAAHGKK